LSNRPDAFVLKRAQSHDIETIVFHREQLYETGEVLTALEKRNIDFIVLAGFLWLIPPSLLETYEGRIVNIHPALLPRYGGKGMYGRRVHEAVIASGDEESGISVHFVNPGYDEGDVIFQARCRVEPEDTPESLAEKIHALEYAHYPAVVEELLKRS